LSNVRIKQVDMRRL